MIYRKLRFAWVAYAIVSLAVIPGCSATQQDSGVIRPATSLPATSPWDLAALSEAPTYVWVDQEGPVWSLYYRGESYQGKPTRVFAHYASPATIQAEETDDTYPAVVLVHGGGGRAFEEWAQLWAERGYAAIAMDLGGCGPDRKRLPDGGPSQSDNEKFGAIDQAPENQWTYHSVANVILAHSLIRSFEEVDADRTAVTGISWGGYLTCIVAGLDSRFKAAVPVYGCGFLHENSMWLDQFAKMTTGQKDKWVQLWDPSRYIGSAAMRVFFVHGTNDGAYPLDSYAKTYSLVKGPRNFRITVKMRHGHRPGWAPQEIGLFIDQYLKGSAPLPAIMKPQLNNGQVRATVKSKTAIASAQIHYTTGTEPINELDWISAPAGLEGNQIISSVLPDDATLWFLTVTDDREAIVSSEMMFSSAVLSQVNAQEKESINTVDYVTQTGGKVAFGKTAMSACTPEIRANMKQLYQEKYGLFVHFGPYAQLGGMWKGKKVAAEWIMNRGSIPVNEYRGVGFGCNPKDC